MIKHAQASGSESLDADHSAVAQQLPPSLSVTREALLDGSLLAAARANAPAEATFLSDEQLAAGMERMLSDHDPAEDLWLFGYGSLIWNPAFHYIDRTAATICGWHRRYCLWMTMARGTAENPGLMLALDRGGRCRGMAFRIAASEIRTEFSLPWRREMLIGAYAAKWVMAETAIGMVRAITFTANRNHPSYAGRISDDIIAAHLATAEGSIGSSRRYLDDTVAALAAAGLQDPGLQRLQRQVTARAEAAMV